MRQTPMYCEHCGAPVNESFRFCPECGGSRQGAVASERPAALSESRGISEIKHRWARTPRAIAVLGMAVILVGATPLWLRYKSQTPASDPSEADARKVFEHQRKKPEDAAAHILTFRKVHSESQEILGVIVHFVDYEAEIRFPNGDQTDKLTGRLAFKLTDDGWLGEDGKLY